MNTIKRHSEKLLRLLKLLAISRQTLVALNANAREAQAAADAYPLWVLANMCVAPGHVCFTPDSDRKSGLQQNVMSALHLKQTWAMQNQMSALGQKRTYPFIL